MSSPCSVVFSRIILQYSNESSIPFCIQGPLCWDTSASVKPEFYQSVLKHAYKYRRVVRFVRWGRELPQVSNRVFCIALGTLSRCDFGYVSILLSSGDVWECDGQSVCPTRLYTLALHFLLQICVLPLQLTSGATTALPALTSSIP
jgi:hypothetical protein